MEEKTFTYKGYVLTYTPFKNKTFCGQIQGIAMELCQDTITELQDEFKMIVDEVTKNNI